MIGLIDLQLQSWDKPQLCPPNLEIMKLATYYQKEENKFCRLINLDETELTGYEKIYVFSEADDYVTVPDAIKKAPNVIYGGTAFTNGVYIPFENKLIDYTLARTRIYAGFLKDKYVAGLDEREINRLLDNSYYRWHAGDVELPIPAIQKRHRMYIYDRDFFQEGWRVVIDKILERNPSSINFIHPAHYRKISDFLEVRENSLIAKGNDAYLDLNIPLKETPILMKRYKNRLLASINHSSQVYLSIGGSFHYKTDYFKNLKYKLNLLMAFWSCNIPVKLKYEEPKLGCYDPIPDFSRLLAAWSRGDIKNEKNIFERIPKTKKDCQEREQLNTILSQCPSLEKVFRQTYTSVQKGGLWKNGY